MKKTIAVALACAVWLAALQTASAQPALQKLEELIRSQRAAPAEGTPPVRDKAYLGISVDDRSTRGRGVQVSKVVPGGPADKAGLRPNDMITGLGGVQVQQMDRFAAILQQIAPGEVVPFDVLRGTERHQFEVTFGRPQPPGAAGLQQPDDPAAAPPSRRVEPFTIRPPAKVPPAADLPQDYRDLLKTLQRRIEQLEARVEQLERALGEKD